MAALDRQSDPKPMRSGERMALEVLRNPGTAWLVLVVSLTVTAWAWEITAASVAQRAQAHFDRVVENLKSRISSRLEAYEVMLLGAQGLFEASNTVTRQEWHEFVGMFKLDEKYPGIQGLSHSMRVPAAKLKDFEKSARASGAAGFSVYPKGERDEYWVVTYIEPLARNTRALGYDPGTGPVTRLAMERARDTGLPSITGRLYLVQDDEPRAGFVIFAPIYRNGVPHQTVAERRAATQGWVAAVFRVSDFIEHVIKSGFPDANVEVYDGTTVSRENLLYAKDGDGQATRKNNPAELAQFAMLDVFGRTWTIYVTATPGFEDDTRSTRPLHVLLSGVAISLLLFWTTWSLARTRARALRLAKGMTVEIEHHARQQQAVAALGQRALTGAGIDPLLEEGVAVAAEILHVEYSKVLELQPDGNSFLLRAGVGWKKGHVGRATVGAGKESQAGFTLQSDETVVVEDLRSETRFSGPPLLIEHGVISGMSVVIKGPERPFGVLGVHSTRRRAFTDEDAHFLQAVANVLASAIAGHRANDALRTSREFALNIIESSIDMIVAVDKDRKITEFNRAAEKTFGYSHEEVLGRHIDLLYADPRQGERVYKSTIQDGRCIQEVANRARDGRIFSSLLSASVLRNLRGAVVGVMGVSRDITDLKKTEAALSHLAAIVESSSDAIISTALDDVVLTWNRGAERIFGYSTAEITGRKCSILVPLELQEERAQRIEEIRQGGHVEFLRTEWICKEGRRIHLSLSFSPIHDAGGRVTGMSTIARDITGRMRTEAELSRLATAVEQVTESIVVTDAQGKIQYVNPSFVKISGILREEAIGLDLRAIQGQLEDEKFQRELWQTLQSGRVWRGQLRNRRPGGKEFIEEASITPLRDADGAVVNYVAVKRDVTHERELEEQFFHAQKMDAIGQLAGGVAHDFNNITAVVLGYADLILRDLSQADPLRAKIETIRNAGQRAARVTRQLLAFSRRQLLQSRVIDVNSHLQEVASLVRQLIGENINLVIIPFRVACHIEVDPSYLDQAILNLAVNGRDAMPNGGALTLAVTVAEVAAAETGRSPDLTPGTYVVLSISDTGVGMTPEVRARVFEPFFTTKAPGKGTGLGLSTTYGIVEQSGGHIVVDSEPGRGTTFQIHLPRVSAPEEEEPSAPVDKEPLLRGTETILVVEDEEQLRQMVSVSLSGQGYRVLQAANAQEALDLRRQHSGAIDLLFTDIIMPGLSGAELAKQFSEISPGTRVLFTTGYAEQSAVTAEPGGPAVNVLSKPYHLSALSSKVREVLNAAPAAKPG